jgi:L-ascorbate metabolism protein UlaG (beta-lactamase superfamily)
MSSLDPIRLPAPTADPAPPDRGSIQFIGTATVILRVGGFTILTDPNFIHAGDHVHLGYGMTAERLTEPAMDIAHLPPLDLCLLSHYHGDHFDQVAEAGLRKDLPIVTNAHAARKLSRHGFTAVTALATWDSVEVVRGASTLRLVSMPGKHAPTLVEKLLPPVMGTLIELPQGAGHPALRIYVTGDTLVHDRLREIPRRFPEIDLALFHLGGTRILGLLVTMDARQGVEAMRIVNPREVVPIHYDDYAVFRSPLADFQRAVTEAGLAERVRYLRRGETYRFEAAHGRWVGSEPASDRAA